MADNKRTSGGSNQPKPGGNTPKPGVSAKDRSRQQSRPVTAKAPAKKGGPARGGGSGAGGRPPVKKKAGSRPKGPSGAVMAWGAVAVVIVVVVVLVVIKVTSGSPSTNASFTPVTAAPASVVSKVVNIPDSVYNQVGVTSSVQVSPPIPLSNQPILMLDGKPGMLYVGAEYCPYCAAERWALVSSLSRFGTFSNLKVTASSHTDQAGPNTSTFSFEGSTFTSPYLTFQAVEQVSNIPNNQGYYEPLDKITKAQQAILNKYEQPPLDPNAQTGQFGYPFVDIGNQAIVPGPGFNPLILANLSHSEIANGLSDPSNPVTQAIVATSNYISAGICATTKNQPTSVCQSAGVQAATKALAAAAK